MNAQQNAYNVTAAMHHSCYMQLCEIPINDFNVSSALYSVYIYITYMLHIVYMYVYNCILYIYIYMCIVTFRVGLLVFYDPCGLRMWTFALWDCRQST